MPISTERAKEVCKAVVLDDSERAQLLGRRDIIKVLESPLLSEDDKDTYIVDFLKSNVAGEIQILCRHHAWLHAMLPTLYFAILNIFFLLHGQAVKLVTILELEVGIFFLFMLHFFEPRLTVVVLHPSSFTPKHMLCPASPCTSIASRCDHTSPSPNFHWGTEAVCFPCIVMHDAEVVSEGRPSITQCST